jgi:ribose 5-phosphate isomerase A
LAPLDLTIDGADEADRNFDLIKGAGGALLREKIVASSSRRMIVVADESKLVARLGKFPLPVEVIEFGQGSTVQRIAKVCVDLGYGDVSIVLRKKDGQTVRTDSGNVIYDCHFGAIKAAKPLADALSSVTGVVEHGLFIGIATTLLIANPGEVEVIEKK